MFADWLPSFMTEGYTFIIIMAVLLVGLIGLFIYLRKQTPEE